MKSKEALNLIDGVCAVTMQYLTRKMQHKTLDALDVLRGKLTEAGLMDDEPEDKGDGAS